MSTRNRSFKAIVLALVCVIAFSGCPSLFQTEKDGGGRSRPGSIHGHAFLSGHTDHSGISIFIEEVTDSKAASVREILGSAATDGSAVTSRSVTEQTSTDSSGSYSASNIKPGTYTIYASHDQTSEKAVARSVTIEAKAAITVEDLYLTPAGTISGVATTAGTAPDGGIVVYIAGTSYIAITDENGAYEITGVPAGSDYVLVASKNGWSDASQTVAVTGLQETSADSMELAVSSGADGDTTPPVIGSIAHIPATAIAGQPVVLIVDAQDPESILSLSYDMDGDGVYGVTNTTTFAAAGTYTVSVTATSGGGSTTQSHEIVVVTADAAGSLPRITGISHSPSPAEVDQEVTITVDVAEAGVSPTITYDTDGDGNFDDTAVVTFSEAGTKTVQVRVVIRDVAVVQTHYVTVVEAGGGPGGGADATPPVIQSVTYSPQPVTVGTVASLIVDAQDPESIVALTFDTDGDGSFDDDSTPVFATTGTHTVTVKATSSGGEATETVDIEVVTGGAAASLPQIVGISHSPAPAYTGNTITITVDTATEGTPPTVTYDTDLDGAFDDPATVSYGTTGIKTVRVKVANAGASVIQTHYIPVLSSGAAEDTTPPVIAGITYAPIPARIYSAVTILVDAQDPESVVAVTYDTDGDGSFDDTNTPTFTTQGIHTITVKATSDGGSVTQDFDIEVGSELPDQSRPHIQSITHSPDPAYTGMAITVIVSVIENESTPTISYDTDLDGDYDDTDSVTYTSSGTKAVDVKVTSEGGVTYQTHYITVLSSDINLSVAGPSASSDTTPTWTWNVPTGVQQFQYRLERVDSPTNQVIVDWTETGDTGTTSYTPAAELTVGESYIFKVQAQDAFGEWSETAFRTTLIIEPSSVYSGDFYFDGDENGLDGDDFTDDIAAWNAGGYTEVTGDVYIYTYNAPSITNLDFLAGLQRVGGNLTIYGLNLSDLSGLSDLVEVGGTLRVGSSGNQSLVPTLNGLESLDTIGSELILENCPNLVDITGLSGLRSVGGYIDISNCDSLTSLGGLQNLSCEVTNLMIDYNDVLQDISSLSGVTVNGVNVAYNPDLTSLNGLQGVRGNGGNSVRVVDNDSITDLAGLENLGYVGSSVIISDNDLLQTLDGLGSTYIDNTLTISGNPALTDIGELSNHTILNGLIIDNNDALTALIGLHNVSTVAGSVTISGNAKLGDFSAIDFDIVEGSLTLSDNGDNTGSLIDFSANGGCSFGSVQGSITIADHPYLESLAGLGVSGCGIDLSIYRNTVLSNIQALSGLSGSDAMDLYVWDNYALTDLAGLSGMTRLYDVWIYGNTALLSLDGLDNVARANTFQVYDNAQLTDLSALSGMRSEQLRMWGLNSLADFTADGGLSGMRIDDSLEIGTSANGGNASLANLNGLTDLTLNSTAVGSLFIYDNDALTDISVLASSVTTLEDLRIIGNALLPDLSGLDNLTAVTQYLWIESNSSLNDISALASLSTVYDVDIENNTSLQNPAGLEGITTAYSLMIHNNDLLYLAGGAEEFDITVGAGGAFADGGGTGDYFTFHDGTTTWNVWYNVDGGETAPGGNGIEVAISASDSAQVIAELTVEAIAAGTADVYVDPRDSFTGADYNWDDNTIHIMNATIGNVTDVSATASAGAITIDAIRQGTATGTGLINLTDVTYRLDITHNGSLQTIGLAGIDGDLMEYLYVENNTSLNQGKALRLYDRFLDDDGSGHPAGNIPYGNNG